MAVIVGAEGVVAAVKPIVPKPTFPVALVV